jgi:hypothetical protein
VFLRVRIVAGSEYRELFAQAEPGKQRTRFPEVGFEWAYWRASSFGSVQRSEQGKVLLQSRRVAQHMARNNAETVGVSGTQDT